MYMLQPSTSDYDMNYGRLLNTFMVCYIPILLTCKSCCCHMNCLDLLDKWLTEITCGSNL